MNAAEQQLLEKIANHVGTTAQQAWVILVHMHRINGIVDLICGSICAVIAFVLGFYLRRIGRDLKKENEYRDWEIPAAFSVVAFVVGGLILAVVLDANLLEIINPSGYVLLDMVSKIK